MNRRQALLGVAAGFASVAGCARTSDIGSSPDDTEPKTNDEPEQSRATGPTVSAPARYPSLLVDSEYDQAQAVVVIGNRSNPRSPYRDAKPHEVLVWNDASTTRTMAVELADRREQYELKPDGYLRVQIAKPSNLTVSLPNGSNTTERSIRVPADLVDCNDSQTDVAVRENGSMETSEITTDGGCATVTGNDSS